MSTFTAIPFALSAIAIIIALAFMYLRKHPDAVQSVESEWTKIHTKLDTLLAHVQATHAAALAPVTVALVPVSTPPAAAEVAPAAAAPTVTDRLFGGGGQGAAAPAAAVAPSGPAGFPVNPGTVDFASDGGKNFCLAGNTSVTVPVTAGWAGLLLVQTNETSQVPTVYPYTTQVNGGHDHTMQTSANNPYWLRFGGPAKSGAEIAMPDGPVTLSIVQTGGVVFEFYPSPNA